MKATAQQIECVKRANDGDDLAVNAGPGTGKSTLLRLIAQAKPGQPMVNFCFNRSTKQQADATMPAWIKNYTFHGAAYGYCGKYYNKKLNVKISPKVIAGRFGCDESVAMAAKYALRRYCVSDDNCIAGWHVPREAVQARPENERERFKDDVVTVARKTWIASMDHYRDLEFGVEHDFYLKRWVDEGAKLPGKYAAVMVDECQDMVKANVKALRLIPGQKICVGDRNQQLYDFRQTVNVADEMRFDALLDLTVSHRFGQEIADAANQVLDLFPTKQPHLTGVGTQSEIAYGRCDERHAVLCRSNGGLLSETLNAVRNGKRVHVVGSLVESILLIESAWYLSIGENRKVKHPTLKMIGDWQAVLDMAKEDQELAMAVKRVDEYSSEIPYLCEELRNAGETSRDRADVILSTVHRAKGSEYEVVKLADDFPDLVRWNRKERRYLPMKGELCVFFVAVTRAKRKLYANSTMMQLKTWKEMLSDD